MTLASTLRRISFVLAVVATTSCDSPVEVCTLIGCESGLTVQLSSLPVGEFTVEVLGEEPALHPPAYRYECVPGAQTCSTRILFPGLYLERPYVRVTTAVGTVVHLAEDVTYRTSYPNGRQCGPECRTATIAVDIPQSRRAMTRFALCLIPIVLLGSCDDFTAPQRVSLKADIERTPTGIHYSYVVVNATEEAIFLPTCGGVAPLSFHTLLDGFELDGMATICPADQTMVPLEVPAGTTHQDSGYYGGVSDAYLRPYLMYAESMTGAASSSVSDRTVYVP